MEVTVRGLSVLSSKLLLDTSVPKFEVFLLWKVIGAAFKLEPVLSILAG